MLRICFVKHGSAYDAKYVNVLANMCSRNLAAGTEGTFECFTDDPEGISPHINTRPIPDGFSGWWAKLHLFQDGLFPDGDRIFYIDLDTIILGPLDDIVKYGGPFATLRDFFKPFDDVQSAVMAWPANTQQAILDKWNELGRPDLRGGDQQLIQMSLDERGIKPDFWQDLFPKRFVSYKAGSYKRVPPRHCSVVCFHGQPKPHNCNSTWVDGVWKIDGTQAFEIEQFCNVEDAKVTENIKHAMARPLPWLEPQEEHDWLAVIVGGAPSLRDTFAEIPKLQNATIFATNGTARFLQDHLVEVNYHVLIDAQPSTAKFLTEYPPEIGYLLGSMCDPVVFDAAIESDVLVTVYHPKIAGIVELVENDTRPKCIVGGGSTVCLKAIAIAYIMGYRKFALFGMDSSYSDDAHHAYPQAQNDDDLIVQVEVDGKLFKTSPWMVAQADEFQDLLFELLRLGCEFEVYGDGLIPYVARETMRAAYSSPAQQRAQAILDRLPDGTVRGAEIGVFAGDLSSRLLARSDLHLAMVDSWLGGGLAYDAHSDDFHASLTQEQQNAYMAKTMEVTNFAKARRTVMMMDSRDAAEHIPDNALDFVFIDADHSYEGCRRDIHAWYPKLKDGALLSGHDYDHPEFPSWGVKRAVDEFAKSHGLAIDLGENMTWFIVKPLAKEIAA